ncbi:Ubiquitin specific protease, conserved site,Peptidase C19, ubiquitin carboxyl-terminal [Cinara cedri]|uniref:Ubiquitin carboxyl-terminal hydrolase n=1 Tax=Cinara cedri TaxID=506608 RepID=A0A5E4MZH6_9HEMI|nr:Ubiquitin specific protease, conserved site,Peptidase C19, ubiquitin carboxyl-terminal [Cinara cedri]
MPIYKVKVKWGKEVYPDVEINTDEPPLVFKAQLFALTGVNPVRQKVMMKGGTLKDDVWGNIQILEGQTILMMGSKDEDVPKEPTVKPMFVEDMTDLQLATVTNMPAGLTNLGNTCYLNATVQCLKTVPELRQALSDFSAATSSTLSDFAPAEKITIALRDLYQTMQSNQTIPPIVLLQVLHHAFPRFADKVEGHYIQQDANECWVELIRMLQQKLPALTTKNDGMPQPVKYKSAIDQFFGGSFNVEWKCVENVTEEITNTTESFLQLSCFISQDVKYMHSGLKNRMQEHITKHSPALGKDAVYTKTSKINRLPAYLTIQFVRFFYKEKDKINAKILKDIKFPIEFDAFELCTQELQEKLVPMRNKFKELEDKLAHEVVKPSVKNMGDSKEENKPTAPYWFKDDYGSNNSGYYTLQAVLTHKGRSSSSGHYVGWVRHSPTSDKWVKCDDDTTTPVVSEDILKLSGGGDWHCAYVLLYGPKLLPQETPSGSS